MNILTIAMIVGIIGGVYGFYLSLFGGIVSLAGISSLFTGEGDAATLALTFSSLLVLSAPIIGLVGAGMMTRKPFIGSGLMAVSCIIMFLTVIGIPPAIFLLMGAVLGVIGKYQSRN